MAKKAEMIGWKFGRLKVIERVESDKSGHVCWLCECNCGKVIPVQGANLKSGHTQSCGCLRIERTIKANTTHGMYHSPEYNTWHSMLQRCNNPKNKNYKNYGGRGIAVCDKWFKFTGFFEDMGIRPEEKTIERINNNKGYFKENCCWADCTIQVKNKRMQKNNTTGFVGVRWHKAAKKYAATISANNKNIYLGLFTSISKAIKARRKAEQKYWK